jgi:segregation and condensation protein B
MELHNAIQAILFYQAEPMSIGRLAKLLKRSEEDVRTALLRLRAMLTGTGLSLVENGSDVLLATSPDASSLIAEITKEELSKELSKAALETLAIVLYKGPVTRAEIDYVRGVNSNFILRNLQVRGLVEKVDNPNDQRSFLYKATFQLLQFMGVTRIEDLPEFEASISQLAAFVSTKEEEEKVEGVKEEIKPEDELAEKATGLEEGALDTAPERDELTLELEADLSEEDEAGDGYDDAALQAHREEDKQDEQGEPLGL